MVRAILEGRKTQTRRIITPQPHVGIVGFCDLGQAISGKPNGRWNPEWSGEHIGEGTQDDNKVINCRYGKPRDRLWVRENCWIAPVGFGLKSDCNAVDSQGQPRVVGYSASMDADGVRCAKEYGIKQTPSIHMPRWASRILLEVTDVRLERLQSISEADAKAEGVNPRLLVPNGAYSYPDREPHQYTYINPFFDLWDRIHGPGSWNANPWVWVVAFERVGGGQ